MLTLGHRTQLTLAPLLQGPLTSPLGGNPIREQVHVDPGAASGAAALAARLSKAAACVEWLASAAAREGEAAPQARAGEGEEARARAVAPSGGPGPACLASFEALRARLKADSAAAVATLLYEQEEGAGGEDTGLAAAVGAARARTRRVAAHLEAPVRRLAARLAEAAAAARAVRDRCWGAVRAAHAYRVTAAASSLAVAA